MHFVETNVNAESDSSCTNCLDEESPWMVSNGKECATSNLINSKYNNDIFVKATNTAIRGAKILAMDIVEMFDAI